jgi:signal transduction histidine kinase
VEDVGPGVSLEHLLERVAGTGAQAFTPLGEEVPVSALTGARDRLNREFQVRCTDGHRVELRSNPIPGGGFVTLHTDITERHAMEGQLRQAQKMEAVGQLTGGIAHDFNNILGAILGNLSVLEPAVRDQEETHECWRRAMGAVDRATRQVERLLAFSRRQHLAPEVVDPNALVEGMIDLLEYSLGSGVELHTKLAPDLPPLRVDPGQLENALMNLTINARDAMSGKGHISVNTTRIDADTVEIAVTDNGAGMAQEILERVLEPFFTTKPAGKGSSGLGLSMVYGFVHQSGGNLTIDSRPGQGTRVHILLPVATEATLPPAKAEDSHDDGDIGSGTNAPGDGQAILVRQANIKQHYVRGLCLEHVNQFGLAAGLSYHPALLQGFVAYYIANVGIVIDNQQINHVTTHFHAAASRVLAPGDRAADPRQNAQNRPPLWQQCKWNVGTIRRGSRN